MDVDTLYLMWRRVKNIFQLGGNISPDALHIHLGLIGFFLFYAWFRKTNHPAVYAFSALFICEVLNEIVDIAFDFHKFGAAREWNAIRDFISTLFWPALVTAYVLISDKNSRDVRSGK